jgi:hypothetical protein
VIGQALQAELFAVPPSQILSVGGVCNGGYLELISIPKKNIKFDRSSTPFECHPYTDEMSYRVRWLQSACVFVLKKSDFDAPRETLFAD